MHGSELTELAPAGGRRRTIAWLRAQPSLDVRAPAGVPHLVAQLIALEWAFALRPLT
jgi:hypothetical protein